MADLGEDDPLADRCRKLLEHEAWLESLLEHLLQDAPTREPRANPPRQAPAAMSNSQIPLRGREAQILRPLVTGRSNRQIGTELRLAPGTIRNYLGQLYRKLGVTTRTQAAIRVVELGLLNTDLALAEPGQRTRPDSRSA